jgi:hypothetical protein
MQLLRQRPVRVERQCHSSTVLHMCLKLDMSYIRSRQVADELGSRRLTSQVAGCLVDQGVYCS